MNKYAEELENLFAAANGDRERSRQVVQLIQAGKVHLPPCFSLNGATPEQTARAKELARMIQSN